MPTPSREGPGAPTAPTQLPLTELEGQLTELNYFHGFLPREELAYLLRHKGDFLIRCTDIEKPDKTERREYIISLCSAEQRTKKSGSDSHMIPACFRNMILFKDGVLRKWYISPKQKFDNLLELTSYYKINDLNRKFGVNLRMSNPVPRGNWELDHCDISLGKQLGHGAFGEVRTGKYRFKGKEVDVAVKLTLGVCDLSKSKRSQMMAEARLMRFIVHPNVVRLYGIGVLLQPLYIVLELVNEGGLNSYLKKNGAQMQGDQKNFICLDVAAGVEFIHSKQIIHRDLAARNCLVQLKGDDPIIKISDFGLSKNAETYKLSKPGKQPIKWLAPEILKRFTFSARTDVWAYGIVVCEIFNDGLDPWSINESTTNGKVKQMLMSGQIMDTDFIDGDLSEYVKERILCFDEDKRATMVEITEWLEKSTNRKRRPLDADAKEASEQLKDMRTMQFTANAMLNAGGKDTAVPEDSNKEKTTPKKKKSNCRQKPMNPEVKNSESNVEAEENKKTKRQLRASSSLDKDNSKDKKRSKKTSTRSKRE